MCVLFGNCGRVHHLCLSYQLIWDNKFCVCACVLASEVLKVLTKFQQSINAKKRRKLGQDRVFLLFVVVVVVVVIVLVESDRTEISRNFQTKKWYYQRWNNKYKLKWQKSRWNGKKHDDKRFPTSDPTQCQRGFCMIDDTRSLSDSAPSWPSSSKQFVLGLWLLSKIHWTLHSVKNIDITWVSAWNCAWKWNW